MAPQIYVVSPADIDSDSEHHSPHDDERDSEDGRVCPVLDSSFRLSPDGEFTHYIPRMESSLLSETHDSHHRESTVMDQRKSITYMNIGAREKRSVFQLPAVRRSMRLLNYGELLMSPEILEISQKFMESGPNRATLLHIGYDTAMMNKAAIGARTYREERTYVSTSSRLLSNMHGRHWSSFIVGTIACIGEITFWVVCILRQGTVDVVCGSSLISVLAFGVVNLIGSRKEALLPANRHKRSVDVPMEQLPLSGTTYIRLLGLDVLAAAQQRLSHKYKRVIPPEQSLKLLRKKMVHDVLVECMTTHFLFGAVPIWISLISSLYSWFVVRQDYTLSLLLVLTLISKTITCLALAVSSFHVRISQKLGELEIRRLEADIRTCPPEMIHRITPRFKALLHEAHMCGNLSHKFVIQCVPVILVTLIQFVGGVFGAANVNGSTNTVVCVWGEEEEDEEGTEDDNGLCVPMWMFFATGQCLISMLIWVHGFALLNLAIERDVDQDIVEMNIRLTYSEAHVPNWLLQQMICLERLDGRAYAMPFDFIPSVDASRKMMSGGFTAVVFIAPFLFSVFDQLSSEMVCPGKLL